uniref:Uncharacterized protein n=1 Tax=Anopheles culicifacies TaxID=139723 RepID=A0A182MC74_9DIPT
MRIIHGINFEPELIREYQHVIYQNIVKGMQVLCDARDKLDIPWEHPTSQLAANEAIKFHSGCLLDAEQFHQYVPIINILWTDGAIRKAYDRRREFQINIPFVFVDVGGQRTQRQKWTKCFDCSVTSILFLVSTSEFDQVLAEDRKTNRLEESRNIFDTIVNNTTFEGISIILFLNKTDLLQQKVKNPETDIRWYYPQFTGNPHSILDVQNFILQMFMNVRKNTKTPIYHHFTNAVDTQNIQVVFSSVKDTILHRNLSALMLQ